MSWRIVASRNSTLSVTSETVVVVLRSFASFSLVLLGGSLGCSVGSGDGGSFASGETMTASDTEAWETVGGTVGDTVSDTTGAAEGSGSADATQGTDTTGPTSGLSMTVGDSGSSDEPTLGGGSSGDDGSSSGEESTGGGPPTNDPFEPGACAGVAWTPAQATTALAGMPRQVLAQATIQVRSRTCPGGACGAWGANTDWIVHYLTWSGGVTTRWKDFSADMELVLFDAGATTRLSMQHDTFAVGNYPDTDGILYDFPPSAVQYPHIRAYNQFPDTEYDYIDLDYQVSDGVLVLGDGCAVWTANPFGAGEPHTEQFGAIFRW